MPTESEQKIQEALSAHIDFKWREQSVNDWGANLVAYIDARDVQQRLDDVLGMSCWNFETSTKTASVFSYDKKLGKEIQTEVTRIYGRLSVFIDGRWVVREDVGMPSNAEGEKGQLSDAFKRCAVAFGVGRFLYKMGELRLPSAVQQVKKGSEWVNKTTKRGDKEVNVCAVATEQGNSRTILKDKADINLFAMSVFECGGDIKKGAQLFQQRKKNPIPSEKLKTAQEMVKTALSWLKADDVTKLVNALCPDGIKAATEKQLHQLTIMLEKFVLAKQIFEQADPGLTDAAGMQEITNESLSISNTSAVLKLDINTLRDCAKTIPLNNVK